MKLRELAPTQRFEFMESAPVKLVHAGFLKPGGTFTLQSIKPLIVTRAMTGQTYTLAPEALHASVLRIF